MCDGIARNGSGVEEASVSGVEAAAAAIVSSIEEEGSQQGTTSASPVSGAEQTVPEVPVSSVKQADGDGPTSDNANENYFPGGEEIDQCPSLMRQLTSSDVEEQAVPPEAPISGVEEAVGDSDDTIEYSSGVEVVARSCVLEWHFSLFDRECFLLDSWKVEDTGSGTSGVYRSPVRSLKELEEAVEECNSIHLISVDFVFSKLFHADVPELEGTEDLIELVMRINKDRVHYPVDDAGAFLYSSFLNSWSFNLPNFMKLVLGMVRSSIVCPMSPFANKAAMYSAFMSCHTMP
ncbi:hypothetical protein CY35_17G087200 [Sphagnum magellanicum]|nr:hypothetical protein CY35_17G087200 [Sphagnum magellanicum]